MSDEKDRPKLTVVAENTRQQVDANIMQEEVDYALREARREHHSSCQGRRPTGRYNRPMQ
ncbi:hypothetical protein [Sinorhizobium fredii]|uniref:hypothetical protein n=1 Tax=Rhizobium fredii TaxID=380 RepID=UPI0004B07F6B|nr:hypothetical protein [Sinorhizobium fredii]